MFNNMIMTNGNMMFTVENNTMEMEASGFNLKSQGKHKNGKMHSETPQFCWLYHQLLSLFTKLTLYGRSVSCYGEVQSFRSQIKFVYQSNT